MADVQYSVRLFVAAEGRSHGDVMELVERAMMQAGARVPTFAIRGAMDIDSRPEPAIAASFQVVASDETERDRVLTSMVDWLESREQTPVLEAEVFAANAVVPMSVEGRGLEYDAKTGLLTVGPDAEQLELVLTRPHEREPGTVVFVSTQGPWGTQTQTLLIQRIAIEAR